MYLDDHLTILKHLVVANASVDIVATIDCLTRSAFGYKSAFNISIALIFKAKGLTGGTEGGDRVQCWT